LLISDFRLKGAGLGVILRDFSPEESGALHQPGRVSGPRQMLRKAQHDAIRVGLGNRAATKGHALEIFNLQSAISTPDPRSQRANPAG
jgi:hypothetical protein